MNKFFLVGAVTAVLVLSACSSADSKINFGSQASGSDVNTSILEVTAATLPAEPPPAVQIALFDLSNGNIRDLKWGLSIGEVSKLEQLEPSATNNDDFILYENLTLDGIHNGYMYYYFTNSTFSRAIYSIKEPYSYDEIKNYQIGLLGAPTSEEAEVIWELGNTKITLKELQLATTELLIVMEPIDLNVTDINTSVNTDFLVTPSENNLPTMSLSEFNSLSQGMTKDRVYGIVGSYGTLSSEYGDTQMYSYDGEGSIGANAIITFEDGKLTGKTQFGLK